MTGKWYDKQVNVCWAVLQSSTSIEIKQKVGRKFLCNLPKLAFTSLSSVSLGNCKITPDSNKSARKSKPKGRLAFPLVFVCVCVFCGLCFLIFVGKCLYFLDTRPRPEGSYKIGSVRPSVCL